MTTRNEYIPQTVTHPGVTLKEKLEELGMSQKEFAVRTTKPEQTIVKVINGESSLTPDMAVQFESVLGIPANFWLKRQQNYDEAVARAKRRDVLVAGVDWADFSQSLELAEALFTQAAGNRARLEVGRGRAPSRSRPRGDTR